ncbi:uncharacterized protein CLUP02_02786 [Colletotrichum lupini]|uniref:Uncharacterized protein n=1 Tax=Colletotrichum lupini TaxID=145971 RepID=A0A9Q8WB56_9PEZI|nr:uncharacterized protein CLUP02_02786 [Colletotrichum lupini]UQC77318.1 hypothetical protein CLUP02_02786 [Colletotrichum lupini]
MDDQLAERKTKGNGLFPGICQREVLETPTLIHLTLPVDSRSEGVFASWNTWTCSSRPVYSRQQPDFSPLKGARSASVVEIRAAQIIARWSKAGFPSR